MASLKKLKAAACLAALLILAAVAPAQLTARLSRVNKIVDLQMKRLPKSLNLTPVQRPKLRSLYFHAAEQEQEVMLLTRVKFEQRRQIGRIASNLNAEIKKLLTPKQNAILNRKN